ncbi:MAG: dipicolinate synthase subunit B [Kineothrix sp.]|nr:dipicolinate synthase subunit B [Kineothrix sp.]NBI90324.1 dipicolinate synthase subunit B [Lachnospiraceae bacterium]
MELKGKKIGIAFCGSFCTFDKVFREIEHLVECGAEIYPIFSDAAKSIESRFGRPEAFLERAEEISGRKPIMKIEEAEPIGPKGYLDVLAIIPCTGNTAAKLANGITDTPVLMAAKAHLRNNKPLVIFISTNDGLGMNMKNIGLLLNTKNIYFVPFGQDDAEKKPNSLVAHCEKIRPALEMALEGKQLQPLLEG